MVKKISKKEIKNKLEVCFKKCATGRNQLRGCITNAMDAGFTKEEVLAFADQMSTSSLKEEASLCAITAIGQALQYEEEKKKAKTASLTPQEKDVINSKLIQSFKKMWSREKTA